MIVLCSLFSDFTDCPLTFIHCLLAHGYSRRNIFRDPDVTTDRSSLANTNASQQCSIGINRHMVAQHRMARHTTYRIPVFVRRQFLSCQTDSLEDTDVVSDHAGLTDNGSRPVVDREIVPDLCTRMDIDTCLRMGGE